MTLIRRHLLRGEGLNEFQLGPMSRTKRGVPGSHVDIQVNVNAQNRSVGKRFLT